jgi:hypothetical protein
MCGCVCVCEESVVMDLRELFELLLRFFFYFLKYNTNNNNNKMGYT